MARPEATVVYTDGGSRPNPGPGAWAAVIVQNSERKELVGGDDHTTNNRMELMAAISALEFLPPGKVDLFTDSTYVRQGITSWLPGWVKRNWQRRQGGEVKNQDLWKRLAAATSQHDVDWIWVKGHAGTELNERADELATEEILRRTGGAGGSVQAAAVPELPACDTTAHLVVRCVGSNGAWLVQLEQRGQTRTLSGHGQRTSANRLALDAALALFEEVAAEEELALVSGSDYLRQGATEWLTGWKQRGWSTSGGDPVKNRDLWVRIDRELATRKIHWRPFDKKTALAKELKKRVRDV